jgi:glycosyltransferase involved in cell wall biosynthesis
MQNNPPTVSIILPVFNAGNQLSPAVKSVINQTFTDWELIVIDDGSSDNAVENLKSFTDPRIRIFRDGKNKGLAPRLNEAVSLAYGRYIARMDQDDLCFPKRIEKQVEFLDSHLDVDLLSTKALVFNSMSGHIIGMLPHRETHAAIIAKPWRGMSMPHPTWMGRAAWFRRFHYKSPEVMRAEDQELLLRAYPDSKYHSLPDVLLAYRQGNYNFRKTLVARKSLFRVQIETFLNRGQHMHFLKTIAIAGLKLVVDGLAALPGFSRIFFWRMNYPVPDSVRKEFETLWKNTRN